MQIKVNERMLDVVSGISIQELKASFKPEADIVIFNGAVVNQDVALQEGDRVVFIKRGEAPKPEEFEALLSARHTPGVYERLKQATVGIAGAGGLGSAIAVALTRVGVGKIIIVDFDVVEPSNLNRQQFFIDQIGMYKVEALVENLKRINPYLEFVPKVAKVDSENITDLFAGVDVLVEAFDRADAKKLLADSMGRLNPDLPLILASGLAGYGSNNSIETVKLYKNTYLVGDCVSGAKPGMGLMAPRVGIAASHEANAVVRILMGEDASK